jgi:hypothetical protein
MELSEDEKELVQRQSRHILILVAFETTNTPFPDCICNSTTHQRYNQLLQGASQALQPKVRKSGKELRIKLVTLL